MICDCCGKVIEPGLAHGNREGFWYCSECEEWGKGQYQSADWLGWFLILVGVGAVCGLAREVFVWGGGG